MKQLHKILIANRGEVAIRIHRTLARMGIKSVAVYSDADRYARHVSACDEAAHIGAAPATESYLNQERIIEACRHSGAEAVHPGYGFLSQSPSFVRRLTEAGLLFIGPSAENIAALGDKITSHAIAHQAGVPTIPGQREALADAQTALEAAHAIGFPVLLKAAAGGGGKGIHIAHNEQEVLDGFRLATSEAQSAFGDARVLIEKRIERARHIEIQVLSDQYGNAIHLNERECSIQRRHQKVIEEAPSPFVDDILRQAMADAALALVRTAGYSSAGTVEFLVDADRNFYFLEMNTRLQVEHAVTELITDIDLVEWMVRIAAGERLTLQQQALQPKGWAIEARIYAEDPNRGFLPSTGRLVRYRTPAEERHVRVDNGQYEGGEVYRFYDPMIAKVTTWDLNRPKAILRLRMALDEFYIQGISHNIAFLTALLANPRFLEGRLSTDFIAEEYHEGFRPAPLSAKDLRAIIAAGALMHIRYLQRAAQTSGQIHCYEWHVREDWVVRVDSDFYPVQVQSVSEGYDVALQGQVLAIRSDWQPGQPILRCSLNAEPLRFRVERRGLGYVVDHLGSEVQIRVMSTQAARLFQMLPPKKPPDMSMYLLSPMPGLLRSITVSAGDEVEPGQELCVVEAMKMENILRAERGGRIAEVRVRPGDTLTVGQVIMAFDQEETK